MKRTAQDNAREFGRITKQGYGVHLAVLVACSVEAQQGKRPTSATLPKLSQAAFAAEAGVSPRTVANYLDKWDRMVAAGWDVDRQNLTPDDVDTLQLSDKFVAEFDALAVRDGGTTENGLTGKAADIAKNTQAMKAAIIADPKVAAAALDAVTESDHRGVPGVSGINRPPRSPEGKAFSASVAATNSASRKIAGPILQAAVALQQVQRDWDGEIGNLAPADQRGLFDALNEVVVIAESLKMALDLDQATGVTR